MARIRSIHPGQWTDESFVACSPLARLLAIGLRNEADDEGVFQWKPLTLKMRLLPADNADVSELLAELEAANIIRKYEVDGAHYGAVRNFYAFQRPKFPKLTHPRLPWVPAYCGVKGAPVPNQAPNGSEPLPQRFGTATEIAPQMESESVLELEGGTGETGTSPVDAAPSAAPAPQKRNTGPKARAKPTKRIRKLDELIVDAELRALAAENGRDVDRELVKFTDNCRAKAKRFDDYRAAFRNWLRSPYGRPEPKPNGHAQPPPVGPPRAHNDPWKHLSPWQETQLRRKAEDICRAERQVIVETSEGARRVHEIMLELDRGDRTAVSA